MDRGTTVSCTACGERVDGDERHRCDGDGQLRLEHDVDAIATALSPDDSPSDQWRYAPLFPTGTDTPVTLSEGGTDLVDAPTLGADLGVDLWLKIEGANPTGSTKDRGSSLIATHARERGDDVLVCASTGNAAASVAAYAARSGLSCCLFVPSGVPETKAVQPLIYGADVLAVEGTYDDAYDLCRAVAAERGWLDRSPGASIYTQAGARSLGYELADQADPAPDWLVVPMGNGGTIAGAWSGYRTFAELGYVDETPRMLGVQAAGTTAIHDAITGSIGASDSDRSTAETCADSIAVGTPHRLAEAREAIEASGGTSVVVDDDAIRSAATALGRQEGVFVEPACAAAIAGIDAAVERGAIDPSDRVVAVMTGNGLKDGATARSMVEGPTRVSPDADPSAIAERYGPVE